MSEKKREYDVYDLRTVDDFRRIPADKRRHCVEDFLLWLVMAEHVSEIVGIEELAVVTDLSVFRWVDDGKHDANFKVTFRPTVTAVNIDINE